MSNYDYKEVIRRLKLENEFASTTPPQREANFFRIKWYEMLNRERDTATSPQFLDAITERLNNKEYICAPNFLLDKE